MTQRPSTIAIDGPAASGKSTLALRLSRCLDYLYFDTGVMYRAVTLAILDAGADLADVIGAAKIARTITIDVLPSEGQDERSVTVLLDGLDVTWQIRESRVDKTVSIPSMYATVRDAMTEQQRRIAARGKVVMVGRDIGTVVLPDADLKIFLEAPPEVRASRRVNDYIARGRVADYDEILADLRHRDELDRGREVAPLYPASDAHIIDTGQCTSEELFSMILPLVGISPDECEPLPL